MKFHHECYFTVGLVIYSWVKFIDVFDMCYKVVIVYFEGAGFGINSDGFFELQKLPQYVYSNFKCKLQQFT